MKSRLLFLAFALAVGGCTPLWTRVDQPKLVAPNGRFGLAAPVGWVQLNGLGDRVQYNGRSDAVVLTRDGLGIQLMEISQLPQAAAFPKTKVHLPAKAPISELADALLAERRSMRDLANLEVVDNQPATVAGAAGCRVRFSFRNERGARFEALMLGSQRGDEILQFTYVALGDSLFARDLPAFERVVASYGNP